MTNQKDDSQEKPVIRKKQMDALSKARVANNRQTLLEGLRTRGFLVKEDSSSGDILLEDAAGGTARITTKPDGVSVTSGEGRTHRFEHDYMGRLLAITDPAGLRISFDHDTKGRLVAIRRGQYRPYHIEYDDDNNLKTIRYPDNTATHFTHDNSHQLVAATDRNGNQIRYRYSEAGLPTEIKDQLGNETSFEYDEWDSPSSILFPNDDIHEFEYNSEGHLRKMLENQKDHACFDINEEAGTIKVEYADGTKADFVLNNGRIIEATNETCSVKFEYDDQGCVLCEETDGQKVTYLRNKVGALIGLVTPDGEKLIFERDKEHRVCKIIDWSGGNYKIEYELNGALAAIRYPNGTSVLQETNTMGLPESLKVLSPRSPEKPLTSSWWTYDECDRVKSMTRDGETREYNYDREGRLLQVTSPRSGFSEQYELDPNGNRVKDERGNYEFNGFNQLVRRGKQEFKYNGRGNMSEGVGLNGKATYTYNGRDQLVAMATSSGEVHYAYDALGRRIRKEIGGKVTRYIWVGQQLLSEITSDRQTNTRREFLMFPERAYPLAMRVDHKVYYLHPGRLAEPICMTDANGYCVWKADYTAFGSAHTAVEKISQPWRLAGQYYDEETGLHYALARYYNPELGCYLTLDPLRSEGGSLNFYNYCDGDPVNRVDPTGEFIFIPILIGFAIGAAIGAGVEAYRQYKTNGKIDDGWGIAKAALLGGAIGAVGAGVGLAVVAAIPATSLAGIIGVGTLSGMASSAAEQCVESALTGKPIDGKEFLTNVAIGGAIGGVTAGVAGIWARRAKNLATGKKSFVGKVGGKKIEMRGVKMERIKYTKRPRAEYDKLRSQFKKPKANFVKDLANDPKKLPKLKKAGLSAEDIDDMQNGLVPDGWNVHHKVPLDDGGTNDPSNFILIKEAPQHTALTNFQRETVGGIKPGVTKEIDFPIPEGFIYPPK